MLGRPVAVSGGPRLAAFAWRTAPCLFILSYVGAAARYPCQICQPAPVCYSSSGGFEHNFWLGPEFERDSAFWLNFVVLAEPQLKAAVFLIVCSYRRRDCRCGSGGGCCGGCCGGAAAAW